jgi:hypothetical protein
MNVYAVAVTAHSESRPSLANFSAEFSNFFRNLVRILWIGCRPVARGRRNMKTRWRTSMPRVGFEPTTHVSEWPTPAPWTTRPQCSTCILHEQSPARGLGAACGRLLSASVKFSGFSRHKFCNLICDIRCWLSYEWRLFSNHYTSLDFGLFFAYC